MFLWIASQPLMVVLSSFMALNALSEGSSLSAKRAIVIEKATRMLLLLREVKKVAQFPAAFGIDPDSETNTIHSTRRPRGDSVSLSTRNAVPHFTDLWSSRTRTSQMRPRDWFRVSSASS